MTTIKTCKQCGNEFPKFAIMEGRRVGLHKRHYCLMCSPWQSGKKRHLFRYKVLDGVEHKQCSKCLVFKLPSEYCHPGQCKSCRVDYERQRTQALKKRAIAYKGGQCQDCSGVFPAGVYDFHHLDPIHKDFSISSVRSASWQKIKPELDKCVLLCANCHRTRHSKL